MTESTLIWAFAALMVINLAASFVFLLGFAQLKASARKAYQNYTQKAR